MRQSHRGSQSEIRVNGGHRVISHHAHAAREPLEPVGWKGLDDVGQAYDLALMDREKIVATLGRHSNDFMTSFYIRTPSEFFVEYGWGGRDVDDATWQPREVDTLASFWGHDGLVRAVGGEDPPLELRHDAGNQQRRAPLQVISGREQDCACPWRSFHRQAQARGARGG